MSAPFACDVCFDTGTIDFAGSEIVCSQCAGKPGVPTVTVKLTGLGFGLGEDGKHYRTCTAYTRTTITFEGTKRDIRADTNRVRNEAERAARIAGHRGRNSISSGAIAIDRRVRDALLLIPNRKQTQS
jgi:hypothetical protein